MDHVSRRPRVVPVPPDVREFVAELVRSCGASKAASQLELSRGATLALAFGLEASRGTIAIAQQAKAKVA